MQESSRNLSVLPLNRFHNDAKYQYIPWSDALFPAKISKYSALYRPPKTLHAHPLHNCYVAGCYLMFSTS